MFQARLGYIVRPYLKIPPQKDTQSINSKGFCSCVLGREPGKVPNIYFVITSHWQMAGDCLWCVGHW
jgi:hypothetical protein